MMFANLRPIPLIFVREYMTCSCAKEKRGERRVSDCVFKKRKTKKWEPRCLDPCLRPNGRNKKRKWRSAARAFANATRARTNRIRAKKYFLNAANTTPRAFTFPSARHHPLEMRARPDPQKIPGLKEREEMRRAPRNATARASSRTIKAVRNYRTFSRPSTFVFKTRKMCWKSSPTIKAMFGFVLRVFEWRKRGGVKRSQNQTGDKNCENPKLYMRCFLSHDDVILSKRI